MIQWERLMVAALCGRCGELVEANEPVQMMQFNGMKRRLIRCQKCVGDAPPDLPEHVVLQRSTKKMQPLARTVKAVADKWSPYKDAD